ncbi:amidase family protein [Amycolatopsis jiangsuensis]|uniref:Amidase n=1 Tax=Amycolatopsis jiangsuensis TaxID=1181879 RepID=A0A840J4T7_9PSEU|nr:amidase family protein [Amycolatopsis jiangsuensis]MBB4688442.1 amidase [Amycolatopsis jiangsuensis]
MVLTAVEIARAVRAGELDPVRVTEEALARIAAADPVVGAFRRVRAERARAEAAEVAVRPDLHELPLAGVPVAVKDVTEVTGEHAGWGSAAGPRTPATSDGVIAARLRAAGAVIVGLTRVPELCIFPMSDDPGGVARNPREPSFTAGGSSGGSAAAVAAGLVPIAHGTDGLGSIRLPSAMCGVVGLKPGRGVVREPGEGWFGMSAHGPIATTPEDAALLLSVLAERPELATLAQPGPQRIAVSTQVPFTHAPLPRPLGAAVDRAAELLRADGHSVVEATPRYPLSTMNAMLARWFAGPAEQAAADGFDLARLQPRTRTHVRLGKLTARWVRERSRTEWLSITEAFFADHDVLVTPALATMPPKARRWHRRPWPAVALPSVRVAAFAGMWNLAGYPALAVPIGHHPAHGLPTCVQLVAGPGGEALLLGLAAALESANPWPRTV